MPVKSGSFNFHRVTFKICKQNWTILMMDIGQLISSHNLYLFVWPLVINLSAISQSVSQISSICCFLAVVISKNVDFLSNRSRFEFGYNCIAVCCSTFVWIAKLAVWTSHCLVNVIRPFVLRSSNVTNCKSIFYSNLFLSLSLTSFLSKH